MTSSTKISDENNEFISVMSIDFGVKGFLNSITKYSNNSDYFVIFHEIGN